MGKPTTLTDTAFPAPYLVPVYVEPSVADALLNQASAAQTVTGNSAAISATGYQSVLIGVNITAVSGTSPTMTLSLQSLGADGIQYTLWSSASQTATGQVVTSVGPGMAQAQQLGQTIRLVWTIGGTTPSFTFSASIIGRQAA